MKIKYFSDLHMEFGKFRLPEGDFQDTVLVLAGDIHVGMGAKPWILEILHQFKAIIYVAGNHEFYNRNYGKLLKEWRKFSDETENFYFLERNSVIIDGFQFLGATLWTDMNKGDPMTKSICNFSMNDYKQIRWIDGEGYNKRKAVYLNPNITETIHKETVHWLDQQDWSISTIVVTHHCPHEMFLNKDRYGTSDVNYAYFTDLSDRIKQWRPIAWIAGHTHKFVQEKLHYTLMLSNPRGYIGYDPVKEFKPELELSID